MRLCFDRTATLWLVDDREHPDCAVFFDSITVTHAENELGARILPESGARVQTATGGWVRSNLDGSDTSSSGGGSGGSSSKQQGGELDVFFDLEVTMDKSEYDAFAIEVADVGPTLVRETETVVSAVPHLRAFLRRHAKTKFARVARHETARVVAVLTRLVYLCSEKGRPKGSSGDADAEFNAVLAFDGLVSPQRQQFMRELRVIDVLVQFLCLPFKEHGGSLDPETVHNEAPAMARVIKLVFKALEYSFRDNRVNELYTGVYISVMLRLLGRQLGAENCLTKLLSNNAQLLDSKISDREIETFIKLIKTTGLQAIYLNFLTALCSCLGTAVMSNQQLICKKLLEENIPLLITTVLDDGCPTTICDACDLSPIRGTRFNCDGCAKAGKVFDLCEGCYEAKRKAHAGGKHKFTEIAPRWYSPEEQAALVTGVGTEGPFESKGKPLAPNKAFESLSGSKMLCKDMGKVWASKIREPLESGGGMFWIMLSWQGEEGTRPADLFAKRTVVPLHEVVAALNETPPSAREAKLVENYQRRLRVAEAYEAQLLLFAELCYQRNYLSIMKVEQQFSYEIIITAVKDDMLPPRIRAAFYRLLCALWVDRAPQTVMIVPKLVRLWVKVDEDSDTLICSAHCDKFAIAEDVISDHFIKCKGSQYAEEREMNKLTLEVLKFMELLVDFGMYGTVDEIKDIIEPLINTMDGTNDGLKRKSDLDMNAGGRKGRRRTSLGGAAMLATLTAAAEAGFVKELDAHAAKTKTKKGAGGRKRKAKKKKGKTGRKKRLTQQAMSGQRRVRQLRHAAGPQKTDLDLLSEDRKVSMALDKGLGGGGTTAAEGMASALAAAGGESKTARYEKNDETVIIMDCKRVMCDVCCKVAWIGVDFRLSKLLVECKSMINSTVGKGSNNDKLKRSETSRRHVRSEGYRIMSDIFDSTTNLDLDKISPKTARQDSAEHCWV